MMLQQPIPFAYFHVLKMMMIIVLLMVGYSLVSVFEGAPRRAKAKMCGWPSDGAHVQYSGEASSTRPGPPASPPRASAASPPRPFRPSAPAEPPPLRSSITPSSLPPRAVTDETNVTAGRASSRAGQPLLTMGAYIITSFVLIGLQEITISIPGPS